MKPFQLIMSGFGIAVSTAAGAENLAIKSTNNEIRTAERQGSVEAPIDGNLLRIILSYEDPELEASVRRAEVWKRYQASSPEIRAAFADWLGSSAARGDHAVPLLIDILRDSWRAPRRRAAVSLARRGRGAFSPMIAHLASNRWQSNQDTVQNFLISWALLSTTDDPTPELLAVVLAGTKAGVNGPGAHATVAREILIRRSSLSVAPLAAELSSAVLARDIAHSGAILDLLSDIEGDRSPALDALAKLIESDLDREQISNAMEIVVSTGPVGWSRMLAWAVEDVGTFRSRLAGELLASHSETHAWLAVASPELGERVRIGGLLLLLRQPNMPKEAEDGLSELSKSGQAELSTLASLLLRRIRLETASSSDVAKDSPAAAKPVEDQANGLSAGRRGTRTLSYTAFKQELLRIQKRFPVGDGSEGRDAALRRLANGTRNAPELLAETMVDPTIMRGSVVGQGICHLYEGGQGNAYYTVLVDKGSWQSTIVGLGACPKLWNGERSLSILRRVMDDPASFPSSVEDGGYVISERPEHFLENLRAGLLSLQSLPDDVVRVLDFLAGSENKALRIWAIGMIGDLGPTGLTALSSLKTSLESKDESVSVAAATALVQLLDEGPDWERAAEKYISYELDQQISSHMSQMQVAVFGPNCPEICPAGGPGRSGPLPRFPWPPPANALPAVFGRDIPVSVIGGTGATLGVVYDRLYKALRRADRNFNSSIFGVPGGFALMARTEQVDREGVPLAGPDRWRNFLVPPLGPKDFVIRLMLAPAGYYRTIVFVFTSDTRLGEGKEPMPAISTGHQILPPELAKRPVAGLRGYALVYSYARRDLGKPHPHRALDATIHIDKAGVFDVVR